jgi:hypothetical protein
MNTIKEGIIRQNLHLPLITRKKRIIKNLKKLDGMTPKERHEFWNKYKKGKK